jgi:hypothetical protein
MRKADAIRKAIEHAGDPDAEVESVTGDNTDRWAVTLRGDLRLPRGGPAGVAVAHRRRCHGACLTFDATDPDRTEPVSVEAWNWY